MGEGEEERGEGWGMERKRGGEGWGEERKRGGREGEGEEERGGGMGKREEGGTRGHPISRINRVLQRAKTKST